MEKNHVNVNYEITVLHINQGWPYIWEHILIRNHVNVNHVITLVHRNVTCLDMRAHSSEKLSKSWSHDYDIIEHCAISKACGTNTKKDYECQFCPY